MDFRRNAYGVKYYNSSLPGSYSGLGGFIKNNKTSKNTKTWAATQRTFTLHQRKTIVSGIEQKWQCELCDIQNLSAENDGFKYLLVNIDVFSKFTIVYLLKNKTGQTVKKHLYQMNSTSKTKSGTN